MGAVSFPKGGLVLRAPRCIDSPGCCGESVSLSQCIRYNTECSGGSMTDPPALQCVLVGVFSCMLHSEDHNLQSPIAFCLVLTSKGRDLGPDLALRLGLREALGI